MPGLPHHVTQRGARRQRVFFSDADCQLYLSLLSRWAVASAVEINSYCLMPNHVHLIVVPRTATSLARLFRGLHSQYAEIVNARHDWKGHLWQQRYGSSPMDRAHLEAALRYLVLNPVRAELVRSALDWPWSSVKAHLGIAGDPLLASPLLRLDQEFVRGPIGDEFLTQVRAASRTGRPIGSDRFLQELEERTGRRLHLLRPGPRPRRGAEQSVESDGRDRGQVY